MHFRIAKVVFFIFLASAIGLVRMAVAGVQADTAQSGELNQLPGKTAVATTISTAFTYQGTLAHGGSSVNGLYDFRFALWDAVSNGTQVGSTQSVDNLPVTDGLFTVALDFGAVFIGAERYLEISIREGDSTGSFTRLAPRQPLTAVPYALGLAPGATIVSDTDAPVLNLTNQAGGGLRICANGDNHGCQPASTHSGVEISHAEDHGLLIDSAGVNGVQVNNADAHGLLVNNAAGNGLSVLSAGNYGIHVFSAEQDGVRVQHADRHGVYVCATGSQTSCPFPSDYKNGVEVGSAEDFGVAINEAGADGFIVGEADGDGLRVMVANVFGLDVHGVDLAGYFLGHIQITGNCMGCDLATFAINTGNETLQPGDIVTIQGTQLSQVDSAPILLEVTKAQAGEPIVGVVGGWAELYTEDMPRPNEIGLRLIPRQGAAEPGAYVTIVYSGLMPVRVSPSASGITAGTRLTIAADGLARGLQTTEVNGVQLTEGAPVIGIALSAPDGDGLVWVLVNPQ